MRATWDKDRQPPAETSRPMSGEGLEPPASQNGQVAFEDLPEKVRKMFENFKRDVEAADRKRFGTM